MYYLIQQLLHYCVIGGAMLFLMGIPCIPVFFLLKKKIRVEKLIPVFLFVGCILVILSATVFDMVIFRLLDGKTILSHHHFINLVPFAFLTEEWSMGEREKFVQVFANILMFVPYGFLLPMVGRKNGKFLRSFLFISLFSFGIEFVQYFIGRSTDIDDFILNVTGGVMGYFLFKGIKALFQRWKSSGLNFCEKREVNG